MGDPFLGFPWGPPENFLLLNLSASNTAKRGSVHEDVGVRLIRDLYPAGSLKSQDASFPGFKSNLVFVSDQKA